MNTSFTIYTLLVLFGCLLTGIFFSWLLYHGTAHLEKKLRCGLAVMRAVVIAGIGFVLFFPLVRSVSYNLEKPLIVIAQDNSLSVRNIRPPGFNEEQYQKDFQKLADELGKRYEVKIYNFSDSVKSGFDFLGKGKLSNGFQFISRMNDQLMNRNVGAMIIASDGIFNRGGSPLYEINKLKTPVYTIAMGDTVPKKDLLIANVNHNNIVYLDNEFTIEVQIQAFESSGETSTLTVTEEGKKLHEENLRITSNSFVQTISLKLKATRLGIQKYALQLSPLKNEISEQNNLRNIFVDVIDARHKVLIAAGAVHPDIAALKQSIALNKYYEVKVAIGDELNIVKASDYSLVILYQLPGLQNEAGNFLKTLQQSGVSTWYILGAQSNLSVFNQLQKQVNYSGTQGALQETFAYISPDFTSFEINPANARTIEDFDPLYAPFGKITLAGNALIALNQRVGKIKTESPLLFFVNDNGKKTAYLIGEGVWRWKLSEAREDQTYTAFNTLISNTVQYLSVKDDKRKFKVYTAKSTFEENEDVLINAVLYNDSYKAVNTPDVSIQLKNAGGKTYNYLFSRSVSAYQLDAGTLPAGTYTYTASVTLGDKRHLASGTFYISALIAEYQQTRANHQLLNALSVQTNGKMYMPQDLLEILTDITRNEQIKTLSYEDRKYQELINFKWLFALLLTLLTAEWFFRKRNGEI